MLARLLGKSDIYKFKIEIFGNVKTFDFLKIKHQENGWVLTQVINITRDNGKLIGDCKIIGYRDSGILKNIRTPFEQDSEITEADDKFIEKTIDLNIDNKNFIGVLEHHPNLKISLDLKKAITKHMAILAKSGAGKSYTVGVILEEVMKKNIPIVILDPHNEYATLKYPNSQKKDLSRLEKFNLKPEGFLDRVKEYSPDVETNPQSQPITLDINKLKPQDLVDSLPQKLSPAQQNIIFNILSNAASGGINIDELIFNISNEESTSKWSLITMLEQLKKLKLFSNDPTPLTNIVKYKQCTIISLKGVEPYVSETFVAGLLRDLFEARKKEEIPPFLLVLEEAHNFCPERALGETKASKTIRTIAGEGRKFGLGLCCISQRPAKVDKNVISQCSTQILLKMTNPNDLKSVIASSEGVSSESENEIQRLNIGTALLTGVIDIPLKVNIRPRISKHGGETVDVTLPYESDYKDVEEGEIVGNISYGGSADETDEEKFDNHFENLDTENTKKSNNEAELIQHIAPEISLDDAKEMSGNSNLKQVMAPGSLIKLKLKTGDDTSILFDRAEGKIVKKIYPYETIESNVELSKLSSTEKKVLGIIFTLTDSFNPAQIMIQSDVTFNEILRVCDALTNKGILQKEDKNYKIGNVSFVKQLKELNFYPNHKFEEVEFDLKQDENITENELKDTFSMFGTIDSIKEVFILKYK